MSTDSDILHLKSQFEHLKDNLAKGGKLASFQQGRSRIRKQATEKGIDPDLVAPLDKKPAKKIEVKLETIAPSITLSTVKPLPIASITADQGIQQRASHIDPALRAEYADAMRQGATFPPITVFARDETSKIWLADGFHRIGAAEDAGLTEILAQVREGGLRDALLYAVGANAEHGARRTTQDKTRAVETLLADAEWSGCSDRWIAATAKVSPTFVGRVRESLTVKTTVHVDSQIDSDTVKSLAGRLADLPEPPARPASARQGRDGRTTNTANIGKKSSTKSTPASTTKPKAPTAADAQQALNRFAGACSGLRDVESKLAETEIFKAAQLARDTLIHLLPKIAPKDRTAMAEKVSAAAGEVGHA